MTVELLEQKPDSCFGLLSADGSSSHFGASSVLQLQSLSTEVFGAKGQLHIDQERAILGLVDRGHRLMLIQRAGYGKSVVHFLAAKLIKQQKRKMTLIVVPLLALAWSQKTQAEEKYRLKAVVVDASTKLDEKWHEISNSILNGDADVIFTTPEQLSGKLFREDGAISKIGLMVIDECHCISEWGSDFRISYLRLPGAAGRLPSSVPLLASTATANSFVEEEIRLMLNITEPTIRGPLRLTSVSLHILGLNFKRFEALAWLLRRVPQLSSSGPGIIFCTKISDCETIASLLRCREVKAEAYYGSVQRDPALFGIGGSSENSAHRREIEEKFEANEIQVLVATTAIGMGFDKRDIHFVILYNAPVSSAVIYQQIGRAGRSVDKDAFAFILFDNYGKRDNDLKPGDCWKQKYRLKDSLCETDEVKELLDTMTRCGFCGVTVDTLCQKVNCDESKIESTLKYLESIDPLMVKRSTGDLKRWKITENKSTNCAEYRERRRALIESKENEWKRVVFPFLVERKSCKMCELTKALGDANEYTCGKCFFCDSVDNSAVSFSDSELDTVANDVKQQHMQFSAKRLYVRRDLPFIAFQEYVLSQDILSDAVEGRVMCHWSDEGWGKILRSCCESFSPYITNAEAYEDSLRNLAEGAADLYRRWKPSPVPKWMTYIPSVEHPTLPQMFCKNFAEIVGLVFVEAVSFCSDQMKRPQSRSKLKNDFHRCRNIDGCYGIDETAVLPGRVILVDYVISSGCTITTVAALLKQNGSGPVIPFAVAQRERY